MKVIEKIAEMKQLRRQLDEPVGEDSEDDGGDSGLIDLYTLDPVGRYGAFNEGVLPESLEPLR